MAGFLPDEGDSMFQDLVWNQSNADRGSDSELILITNASLTAGTTAASLTQPSGTGYAVKPLTDASWATNGSIRSYALQTFTVGAGGWTPDVTGYAVISTGTTPRIMAVELFPGQPLDSTQEGTVFNVTPSNDAD
jgi:hypothetical protein